MPQQPKVAVQRLRPIGVRYRMPQALLCGSQSAAAQMPGVRPDDIADKLDALAGLLQMCLAWMEPHSERALREYVQLDT